MPNFLTARRLIELLGALPSDVLVRPDEGDDLLVYSPDGTTWNGVINFTDGTYDRLPEEE